MSLQGSLETFPLADVVGLLAATSKTGVLRVHHAVAGEPLAGRLWFDGGLVVGGAAPGPTGEQHDVVDVAGELLRAADGTFAFEAVAEPCPAPGGARPVTDLLVEAGIRLEAWAAIEAVVPSLDHRLVMAREAPAAEVTLSAAQWRLLAVLEAGRRVGDIVAVLGEGHFQGCRAVADLVEAGLVSLLAPRAEAAAPRAFEPPAAATPHLALNLEPELEPEPDPEPVARVDESASSWHEDADEGWDLDPAPEAPLEPEAVEAFVPVAGGGGDPWAAYERPGERPESDPDESVDENGEPLNRGLLLKFLSSVRA